MTPTLNSFAQTPHMCMFCFFCFLFKRDLKTYHLLLAWSVEELSFAKQEATKCNCYSAKQSSICLFDVFSFFFTNSKVFSINTSLSVQRRQESMSTSSWQTSRIICMEYSLHGFYGRTSQFHNAFGILLFTILFHTCPPQPRDQHWWIQRLSLIDHCLERLCFHWQRQVEAGHFRVFWLPMEL